MIETNKLYCVNCIDYIKTLPDNSIDLIVTDPPYRITSTGHSDRRTMGGFFMQKKAMEGKIFDNNNISCKEYLPEFYRILKDKTILYLMTNNLNLRDMLNVANDCGFNFVKSLIWEKGKKICGRYYMGCYEYILLFRKGGDRPINDCGTPDILKVPIKKQKDKQGHNLHDTEKPVELMKILIENSSDKNDVVLDPFMGIGSTIIGCVETGRNFIGCEIDSVYFNIAKDRIMNALYNKYIF